MPVFRSGQGQALAWCELEYFDIVSLSRGERHVFKRVGLKEKLIVGKGSCKIKAATRIIPAGQGANIDLSSPDGAFKVLETDCDTILIRMCGRWREPTGGSGIFAVENAANPESTGDPVDYKKTTPFDNHFHDCDEYWIIFEGRGVAVTEGKSFEVGPGDCVATGMGHHHDFPLVFEPVRAAFFETTMEGPGRGGHLWEHKHGVAVPMGDRI